MFGIDDVLGGIIGGAIIDIIVELAPKVFEAVCAAVKAFAEVISTAFGPETDVEELGDKALQAEEDGITPENFESFEEYVEAIDKFELDPEKSKSYTPEEKQSAGIGVMYNASMDNLNVDENMRTDFFELISEKKDYFTPDRMVELSQACSDGLITIADITGYMTDKLEDSRTIQNVRDVLVDIEQKINPEISLEDAARFVRSYVG